MFSLLTEKEACEKEIELIRIFNTSDPKFGYNNTTGGEVGKEVSEESKKKMSENRKGLCVGIDNHNFGHKLPEETRKKISDTRKQRHIPSNMKGKKHKESSIKKMSENSNKKSGKDNPRFGMKHTDETRIKISQNRIYKRGAENPQSKVVIQKDKDGEIIKVWPSCTEAMNGFRNSFSGSIKKCCQGATKTAYGYIWSYAERG